MTREEILRNTTCGDCLRYNTAPDEWANVAFGWCDVCECWTLRDETLWHSGCESFEARPGFEPQPDYDWKDYREWDD